MDEEDRNAAGHPALKQAWEFLELWQDRLSGASAEDMLPGFIEAVKKLPGELGSAPAGGSAPQK